MTSSASSATFLILAVWCTGAALSQLERSPSPASEFHLLPSNTTVPEGEQAILKCMVGSQVHVCRWYFLDLGLDFFDERVSPMLVKDFKPAHHRDCSIRIKKVRKIQEGQWLCQALKFHSTKFLMTQPVFLRVITRSEAVTWTPPRDLPHSSTPRQGRREDGQEEVGTSARKVRFESSPEDYIKNTMLSESVVLKCQVNTPIASCTWVMPNGSSFNVSHEEELNRPAQYAGEYRLEGEFREGNCSLRVGKVKPRDEGDWRCVVQTAGQEGEHHGPLLHLHITDLSFPSNHSHNGVPLVAPVEGSSSMLLIFLVLTSIILLILVILLFSCLYRRAAAASGESRKILQPSPQGSLDFLPHKKFSTTDFTAASVLAVDNRRSTPPKCVDLDHYNQYLDMNGSDTTSNGYIKMPSSSLRSSTSSRTTLSTLSTLPAGRSRSASSSTTLSRDSPGPSTMMDNPSYSPGPPGRALDRPDSLCFSDHVYEEIKEKQEDPLKLSKIPEAITPRTPTYTNLLQDNEGYMIPKKNPATEAIVAHPVHKSTDVISKHPMPSPNENSPITSPVPCPAPPYSRVGQCGLVPASPSLECEANPGPGYSRVGSSIPIGQDVPSDPMERYDVPRPAPTPITFPPSIPVSTEAYVDGLAGILV